jgi:hypothetical protein
VSTRHANEGYRRASASIATPVRTGSYARRSVTFTSTPAQSTPVNLLNVGVK